jgi:hypothetical protein
MFLLIELAVVIGLLFAGCWSKRVAFVFLPVIGVSLTVFAIRYGNPIGLLASGGGWLILNTMLVVAVLLANVAKALIRSNHHAERPDAN